MEKIKSWRIEVELENGDMEWISDIPSGISRCIDDWLTEKGEVRKTLQKK